MNLKDWRFCSQEDDTISLHDCVMDRVEWDKGGLWLIFEDGFNVAKDNSLNPTGRHRLTGKAAVFLKNGSYLESAIQREQLAELSPEVLDFTWEPEKRHLSIFAIDDVGYCEINFSCESLWFCWNELPEDAWFQELSKE